jgi:hypothetical protein
LTRSDLTWIIDGSAMNGRRNTLATFGFAIAIVAKDGSLLAWGSGIPPHWVDSAAGAETWALYKATQLSPWPPRVVTDCLGLVQTAEQGTFAATASRKQLARTWNMIANNLDGDIATLTRDKLLVWMPAHQSPDAINSAMKSNGVEVTSIEWRANRLVDALAKR